MDRKERIMKRLQEHYTYLLDKGYEIVYLSLQGSQNYDLDIYTEEYMSDIDTKAVILPSFEDFVYSKTPISTTLVLENNEHIDVKDIRVMFENYKKQNVNYLETIFTEFKIVNPKYEDLVKDIFENAEYIAHINFNQALRCMAGMSMEKRKALTHPYEGLKDKIAKYGYDGKQLHHIMRMNYFIRSYISDMKFKDCLTNFEFKNFSKKKNKQALMDAKLNKFSLEEAIELADMYDASTKAIKDFFCCVDDIINTKGIEILDNAKYEILKRKFKNDLEV